MDGEVPVSKGTIMNIKQSRIVLLVFLAILSARVAEAKSPQRSEQTAFNAEDDSVKRPVAIPQDVLAALSRDKLVKDVLENENIPAEKIPASWFSASTIHLRDAREADLIVMAVGPLRGANVTMFWIFRAAATGHELLFTGEGHDLTVKNARLNGYREIETSAVIMQKLSTVSYRFEGKQYARYKDTLEEIR
jgi:hypothetical protein